MSAAKPIGLEDLRLFRNRADKRKEGSGEESSTSKPASEKQEKHKLSGDK